MKKTNYFRYVGIHQILRILIVLFTLIFVCIYCQENKDYLNKYNQLSFSPKYNTKTDYKYVNRTLEFICDNPEEDCSGKGKCTSDKLGCICNLGFYSIEGSYIKCSYQQKSKMIALLLEATVGFGFGHLYVRNYTFFLGKFLFYFFSCYFQFCLMIFVGSINNSNVDEKTFSSTKAATFILVPVMIGWYLFDVAMFFLGKWTDSNNIPLY